MQSKGNIYDMKNDNEIEIDLEELFGLILHKLWLILLCGVITGAIGFGVSAFLIAPKNFIIKV